MPILTSRQNPRVKALLRLKERREREQIGQVLIEGLREVRRALEASLPLLALYYCSELLGDPVEAEALSSQVEAGGGRVTQVTSGVFEKLSHRHHPDGFLAVGVKPDCSLERLQPASSSLFLIVEGVEKPGNLGALLRSADATQASLLVADGQADFFSPQVIRNSQGAVFSSSLAAAPSEAIMAYLRQNGVKVVATSPAASQTFWQADLSGPVAIAVGGEANGLSQKWLDWADAVVRIPQLGQADSLNVSVSAALCLYEVVRQGGAG